MKLSIKYDALSNLKDRDTILSLLSLTSLLLLIIVSVVMKPVDERRFDSVYDEIFGLNLNYAVIVDCGSSGSRAYVYCWKDEGEFNLERAANIELARDGRGNALSKHITPGISSFEHNPEAASDYLEPIMGYLVKVIPEPLRRDTPVYFMATAGMRLLSLDSRKKIIDDIQRDLRAKYLFANLSFEVISGKVEGAYSWISLNLAASKSDLLSTKRPTIGMIELGGASLQVTFELNPSLETEITQNRLLLQSEVDTFRNEQINVTLGKDKHFKLFSTTFLGLGVNVAFETSSKILLNDYLLRSRGSDLPNSIEGEHFELSVPNPCLTVESSFKMKMPTSSLSKYMSRVKKVSSSNKNSSKTPETFLLNLEGSGDFTNCLLHLKTIVSSAKKDRLNCKRIGEDTSPSSCAMSILKTSFIPFDKFEFVGLSEFYFTTSEILNLTNFDRRQMLYSTKQICSTNYIKLKQVYSASRVSDPNRLLLECFKASWILVLLDEALGMPHDYRNFKSMSSINSSEINWTLGAIQKKLLDSIA